MEAQRLTDSRVRFLASIAGFDLLVALLAEAKSELWNKEEEFPERVGITSEEYGSLQDELRLVRYGPLGYPRPRDSQTRRALGTHRAEENWHRVGQSAQDGGRGPGGRAGRVNACARGVSDLCQRGGGGAGRAGADKVGLGSQRVPVSARVEGRGG
jgi:hypothetical protein